MTSTMGEPTVRAKVLTNKVLEIFHNEEPVNCDSAIARVTIAMLGQANTLRTRKKC